MYALIIAIHAIFITVSHFLWYRIFEGIFFLLCIFFLFYFSPLFFLDDEEKGGKKWRKSPMEILKQLSPKNSLILPVVLLYIAIYGFLFSLFPNEGSILLYHSIVVSAIYMVFIAYGIAFYWKNDVFFELLRFHTLFTLISSIVFTLALLLQDQTPSLLHPVIALMGILSWTFLLSYVRQENNIFLWSYLSGIFALVILTTVWLLPGIRFIELCAIATVLWLFLFEYFPNRPIYYPYATVFRYFSLVSILVILLPVAYIAFDSVDSLAIIILSITVLFFLSVHRRYTNYVVYVVAILEVFLVYSLLFSGLLVHPDITSVFLFLFFLPLMLIASTYLWDEAHAYDFTILHYSSIAFSMLYCLYTVLFMGWWDNLLFVISFCIFGMALLFFLSYFRFPRKKH